MNALMDTLRIARLGDIYAPYAEKMAEYVRLVKLGSAEDLESASEIFSQAQEIYCAWHAGVEYAERGNM